MVDEYVCDEHVLGVRVRVRVRVRVKVRIKVGVEVGVGVGVGVTCDEHVFGDSWPHW